MITLFNVRMVDGSVGRSLVMLELGTHINHDDRVMWLIQDPTISGKQDLNQKSRPNFG